jgi:hypothetical protein
MGFVSLEFPITAVGADIHEFVRGAILTGGTARRTGHGDILSIHGAYFEARPASSSRRGTVPAEPVALQVGRRMVLTTTFQKISNRLRIRSRCA